MKTVGEFWFRLGISGALIAVGIACNLTGSAGAGIFFIALGAINAAWTIVSANLIIRKAKRAQR